MFIHDPSTRRGFTLIELLIVVAIIAILAAIAVPNFLEAQTRSKVSRTYADMRTLATAIEAYHVDHNRYPTGWMQPVDPADPWSFSLWQLSTPIAYVSSANIQDPFLDQSKLPPFSDPHPMNTTIQYDPMTDAGVMISAFTDPAAVAPVTWWLLFSVGPDGNSGFYAQTYTGQPSPEYYLEDKLREAPGDPAGFSGVIYDPTNGTISTGNLWRAGGASSHRALHMIVESQ